MQQPKVADKNTPYWWEAAPVKPLPPQPLAKTLDVAIVGAGYAGLSAGLVLAREGRSVAAFDAMNPGEGASSRNGGVTSGTIRPDYATITRRFGEDKAMAIEAEGKIAREFLYDFIKTEGLDCDFRLVGAFKGALGYNQYETMARGAETLAKRLGIESYAVPHAEQRNYIGTDFYRGGTVRMDIGGLHPAKFHAELLRVALASGLTVHSNTPVTAIEREGDGFRVATSAGTVQARQVLVCTNGYTDGANPFLRRRLVPVRARIIATEELAPELMARLMPKLMTIGENRQLGFYYRPSPDGRRILLGGRDSSRVGDPAAPTLRLRNGLVETFPGTGEGSPFAQLVRQRGDAPRHDPPHLREGRRGLCHRLLRFGRGLGAVGRHACCPQADGTCRAGALGLRLPAARGHPVLSRQCLVHAGDHQGLWPAGQDRLVARPPLTAEAGGP